MHNISMNKLPFDKRLAILSALVEGNSLRSTSRMVMVSINTVTKFLERAGQVLGEYQHRTFRNLNCKRIQVDEIWSFCSAREKNVAPEKQGILGYGDVWTFTAIDADTKLVPSWMVGHRDLCFATTFLEDLRSRLANRVQLTTDGHRMYLQATEAAFGAEVDYAMLVKMYNKNLKDKKYPNNYTPGECCGAKRTSIIGNPDKEHVSTSYVERQNLTMRMSMRRFTRLTNAFSKKLANLEHMLAIHYMVYNFSRIHMTLKSTPAIKAGVTEKRWTLEDIVNLID
jgi:IS1 family transposase